MVLNRGFYTPWYLCRVLGFPFRQYMSGIYIRPALIAIPLAAAVSAFKAAVFPGSNLEEIAAASVCAGALGWGLGFVTALEREHRELLVELLEARLRRALALFRRQPA
jgi:hypothetical protein